MKSFSPFKNWGAPLIFSGSSLLLTLLSIVSDIGIMMVVSEGLFLFSLLWIFASLIYLLIKKEWRKSFYTVLFVLTMIMIIGLMN